jgi:hypothetical protein
LDILHIKVVFIDKSKKLSPGFGGDFDKKQEGFYILTIESSDAGRNFAHELGHLMHDYLYDDPGNESLPYALENAFTLWWQEHHGEDHNVEFIEDKSVDAKVDE